MARKIKWDWSVSTKCSCCSQGLPLSYHGEGCRKEGQKTLEPMIVQLFLNGCLELNVRDSAVLWCSNCHTRFDESSRVGSIALPVEDGVMGHVMCMRCLKNQARNFGENASYHAYSVVLNPAVRLWIERYKQAYYAKLAAIEAPNDSVAEADLF